MGQSHVAIVLLGGRPAFLSCLTPPPPPPPPTMDLIQFGYFPAVAAHYAFISAASTCKQATDNLLFLTNSGSPDSSRNFI